MKFICEYSCDAACLKIGNKDFSVLISNGFGDGTFKVFSFNPKDEIVYAKEKITIQGTDIKIFDYDCSGGKPVEGVSLTGVFTVYAKNGNIYLEIVDTDPNRLR